MHFTYLSVHQWRWRTSHCVQLSPGYCQTSSRSLRQQVDHETVGLPRTPKSSSQSRATSLAGRQQGYSAAGWRPTRWGRAAWTGSGCTGRQWTSHGSARTVGSLSRRARRHGTGCSRWSDQTTAAVGLASDTCCRWSAADHAMGSCSIITPLHVRKNSKFLQLTAKSVVDHELTRWTWF